MCSSEHLLNSSSPGGGILSPVRSINPHFYKWKKIHIHYCSGDNYVGNATRTAGDMFYHVRGRVILHAVYRHLIKTMALSKADNVLLVGTSSGAFGVLSTCDELQNLVDARVKCVVDSAAIFLHAEFSSNECRNQRQSSLNTQQQFWNSKYMGSLYDREWWREIQAPLYLTYNKWDRYTTILHCLQDNAGVAEKTRFSNIFLDRTLAMERINPKFGLFVPGCVGHELLYDTKYCKIEVGREKKKLLDNLLEWIKYINGELLNYIHVWDDCNLIGNKRQCNPMCPEIINVSTVHL